MSNEYSADEFQKFVAKAVIKHDMKRAIAKECQASVSTVERWALGEAAPHPAIREFVFKHIGPMVKVAEEARRESHNKAVAWMRSMNHVD